MSAERTLCTHRDLFQIYSKATQRFDPKNKGGRYQSEFIWNTNWQEALKRDEDLDRKRKAYVEAQAAGTRAATDAPPSGGSGAIGGGGGVNFGLLNDLNDMSVD
eukprot:301701-Chlamydomonas_euryale.AAC.1